LPLRGVIAPLYLLAASAVIYLLVPGLGTELVPAADAGQFKLRLRARTGTRFSRHGLQHVGPAPGQRDMPAVAQQRERRGAAAAAHAHREDRPEEEWGRSPEGARAAGGLGSTGEESFADEADGRDEA
jgi:hypothetical protein